MAWTPERVEKLLDGVASLHTQRSSKEADAIERSARLEAENAELRAELAGISARHQAAMRDALQKGGKMEALMRQLLDERGRLAEELAALRRDAERRAASQCVSRAVAAEPQTSNAAAQTQTNNASCAVQTDTHIDCPHDSSAVYSYGLLPATGVRYAAGAERLALALYLSGQHLTSVKLDMRGDWIFAALCVGGWWEWRRQSVESLRAAVRAVTALHEEEESPRGGPPLWWAAALGAALAERNASCGSSFSPFSPFSFSSSSASAAELVAAACGCRVAAPAALCGTAALRDFATQRSGCAIVSRGGTEGTRRKGEKGVKEEGEEEAAIVAVACRAECDALADGDFGYNELTGEETEEALEALEGIGQSVLFRVVRPVAGALAAEWWTARRVLDTFDTVRTVHFDSDAFGANGVELRVPCAVAAHIASVALALPSSADSINSAVRAAMHDAQNGRWAPVELLPVDLRYGHFALRCDSITECTAAVLVLRVDAAAVRRVGFVAADDRTALALVAQVDGQELCADHVVLNAAMERDARCIERTKEMSLSEAKGAAVGRRFALAAAEWAAARAAQTQSYACAIAETIAAAVGAAHSSASVELEKMRADLWQCAEAFEVLRRETTMKNAQLAESKRYCCAVEAELEKAASALAELRSALAEARGGKNSAQRVFEKDFT